jgi:hypothetical protein
MSLILVLLFGIFRTSAEHSTLKEGLGVVVVPREAQKSPKNVPRKSPKNRCCHISRHLVANKKQHLSGDWTATQCCQTARCYKHKQ